MFRTFKTFLVKAAENLSNKIFCLGLVRQEKPAWPGHLGTLRFHVLQQGAAASTHIYLGRKYRLLCPEAAAS